MRVESSALTPGTKIDQYVVTSVLGQGGFAITYLVHDEGLDRDFALKEFFPASLARRDGQNLRFIGRPGSEDHFRWALKKFYDEARLLAGLSHANIVTTRRAFEKNNSAYMLQDYIKGRTFEQWLRALDTPPSQDELDLICKPLLSALELIHANRIWHLDISPDNIMIRADDGAPILLDFGAARGHDSELISVAVFKRGYSAPEQYAAGGSHYGPWTDIYSLGSTLYRAISGSAPIDPPSRQLRDDQTPVEQLGKGRYRDTFLKTIDWSLKLHPNDRPQSVGDWGKALLQRNGVPLVPNEASDAGDSIKLLLRLTAHRDDLPSLLPPPLPPGANSGCSFGMVSDDEPDHELITELEKQLVRFYQRPTPESRPPDLVGRKLLALFGLSAATAVAISVVVASTAWSFGEVWFFFTFGAMIPVMLWAMFTKPPPKKPSTKLSSAEHMRPVDVESPPAPHYPAEGASTVDRKSSPAVGTQQPTAVDEATR